MYGNTATDRQPSGTQSGRPSQVQEQVERSAKAIERIQSKMHSLHDRLQPIILSSDSVENQTQSQPRPALVGHAMALANQADQLDLIDSGLAYILDRLEL